MPEKLLRKLNLDVLGIGASLLCAIHCALLPVLITLLPLLGAHLLENEKLEYGLMACTFVIGCLALFRGYRHQHRQLLPLLLFLAGFAGLLLGHYAMPPLWRPIVITAGALLIIIAHIWNLHKCRH
ncbi:MerC mercury resistance protein [Chitinophaga rupis]|uniref:MerC mercury resistance protein n=1 Tax=Chitinophaga rupis TaxID=573321 RepID=A0A1H7J309_9BACT|nr:MerC domain-containing protein [Chitinophaga rupis]SEK68350.1 MerC mercury resistance protein [Chitinophaga rupis]